MSSNGPKVKLQQLLMSLDIFHQWPHDIITLVVDYRSDAERLLLMDFKEDTPRFHIHIYAPPIIRSLSIELLYHIMTNHNNGETSNEGNDDKWLHYDVHPHYRLSPVKFTSIVTMYDHDNDRIIVTGGSTNVATNWNDIQSCCITTSTDGCSSTITTPTDANLLHPLTPMPTPRNVMMHTFLSPHECIIMGGNHLGSNNSSNQVEVYNMVTDKWLSLPDLISEQNARNAACAVDPRNGRIYVFGGGTQDSLRLIARNTVDCYDPMTKGWKTLSVRMKRKRFGAAVIWLPNMNSFL
jgi:hypothetical protein